MGSVRGLPRDRDSSRKLQDDVVHFPERQHIPVVFVHEAFDAEPGFGVHVAQPFRQRALILELQAVILAPGDQVQPIANPHR